MKSLSIFTIVMLIFLANLSAQTPTERTWYFNNKGEKVAVKEKWAEDNTGLKHGAYILYDSDGNRLIYGNYNHGKKHGRWEEVKSFSFLSTTSYYLRITTYNNDIPNGEFKVYKTGMEGLVAFAKGGIDKTTILETQGQFVNGVKAGYWKENYDDELKIFQEGTYKDDARDGKWINTSQVSQNKNAETKLNHYTVYSQGKIISCLDNNGVNLLEKAEFEFKQKQQEEEEKNKQIKEQKELIENVKNGELESLFTLHSKFPQNLQGYYSTSITSTEKLVSEIKQFQCQNCSDEGKIFIPDNFHNLVLTLLKDYQLNKVSSESYPIEISYKRNEGKFKEIIANTIYPTSKGFNFAIYFENGKPYFSINSNRKVLIFKEGVSPVEYNTNLKDTDFLNFIDEKWANGEFNSAIENCNAFLLSNMVFNNIEVGNYRAFAHRIGTYSILSKNTENLEIALKRLEYLCKKNASINSFKYKGLVLWSLQRYDEAVECFKEKRTERVYVGFQNETGFIDDVLDTIKKLKNEHNFVFTNEKELIKRIKSL